MKDAYYFSHDSNARHDPKIQAMRSIYKAAGYGWYWMLVEMMRDQENHKLDMVDKYAFNAFALEMQCTPDEAQTFINDCINEFKLLASDGKEFWSESLLKRMKKREEKSKKASESARKRWENKQSKSKCKTDAKRTHNDSNAIKGKESKGNKNKEDILRVFDFYNEHRAGNMVKAISLNNDRRSKIGARIKEHGLDKVLGVIGHACTLKFMKGETDTGFRGSIDFLMSPSGFIKTMEGNYEDRKNGKENKFGDFQQRDYSEEELDVLIDNR